MPVVTADELTKLQELIEADTREEARLRQAAEKRLADIRSASTPEAMLRDKAIFDEVDALFKPCDLKRDEITALRSRYERYAGIPDSRQLEGPAGADDLNRSAAFDPGARFTSSDAYTHFRSAVTGGTPFLDGVRSFSAAEVMSKREAKESHFGVRERAITLTNLPWSDRQPDQYVPLAARPVVLLDLMSVATTDSSSVDYVQQTARTDAAAGTAYGTPLPEHSLTLINVNVPVVRIGAWTPATEAQLMDQGGLQDLINSDLMGDFNRYVEAQALNGTGGAGFTGILQTSGIATQARGADTWLDAVHKGITQIRLAFGEPDAVGLHPTDLQSLTLQKDAQGNYLFKIGEPASIWGLRPVATPVFTQGTGLLGVWKWATLWTRTGVSVLASNEYSTYFLTGQVAIKAEGRAGFLCKRPSFFCSLTGL